MSAETPILTPVPLAWLVTHWRPGSRGDDWTWAEEYVELTERPETAAIERRVLAEGIGFMDYVAPILLGTDGRVWDGHHRIVLAMKYGIGWVMVEGSVDPALVPAPSVVPEAAVDAVARALADDWNPGRDPVVTAMFRDYARTAVTAALPYLTAAPSEVERIARALTETTALTGADALRIVQAAQAMSAPSATRDEVAR